MQSVAAVYNRLERAALRHDSSALNAWMGRRSDNAVKEAIKHGLRMANDPDYRLGVEADRFARREYAQAFDGFLGIGRKGDQYRALIEGAGRLRYGGMTDAGASAIRREVERLLGVMRAEIEPVSHDDEDEHDNFPELPNWTDPDEDDEPLPAPSKKQRGLLEGVGGLHAVYSPISMAWIVMLGKSHTPMRLKVGRGNYYPTKDELVADLRSLNFKLLPSGAIVLHKAQKSQTAPPPVAPVSVATGVRTFPVRGFAASTLDVEADGLRDDPDAKPFDEDDAAIRVVVRAYEAGNRKALIVSSADADTVIAGLTALSNTEDERAEIERKKPASKRDPESQRMARAASDGLSALSMKIARAFA